MDHWLKKGDRIRARWFEATHGSLAGMQPKTTAIEHCVIGRITHIRGDHPTNPREIRVWVQPDGGGPEVVVNPAHIESAS